MKIKIHVIIESDDDTTETIQEVSHRDKMIFSMKRVDRRCLTIRVVCM
jgi:hypothetical protein